ncbi:MAG: hypothetical protein K2X43_02620 [Hyphomonadaceae bacterium]|nr:hypothetical protein [Hyphomonadaceae bacterium]
MRHGYPWSGLALLSAAVLVGAMARPASAQVTIEPEAASGARFKIVVAGQIDVAALMDFSRAVIDPRVARSATPAVELNSPGGSVFAAMAIGVLVRNGGLRTTVGRRHRCDSACVLILAAGVERHAVPGRVHIHRPRVVGQPSIAQASERYDEGVASMRAYLAGMGVREHLLDAMLHVPPDRFRALSGAELQAFALTTARPMQHGSSPGARRPMAIAHARRAP